MTGLSSSKAENPVHIHRGEQPVAVIRVRTAAGFFSRLRGLLGQRSMEGDGLWIRPCNSIHTCGMRFGIDVVFLDQEGRIIGFRELVKPWRFAYGKGAKSVIELGEGRVRALGLRLGDSVYL